jgi:hypothetical protein
MRSRILPTARVTAIAIAAAVSLLVPHRLTAASHNEPHKQVHDGHSGDDGHNDGDGAGHDNGSNHGHGTICDGLSGGAWGLCNAYCTAKHCNLNPRPSCNRLRKNFLRKTGTAVFPCDDQPTPTGTVMPESTPTETPVDTPASTPTDTPIDTPTDTPTTPDTPTETPLIPPDKTPTDTPTEIPTAPPADTPTDTPTAPATETPTDTPTEAATIPPADTPTDTPTNLADTPTETPTETPTPTATETDTPAAPTDTPTDTPTVTDTPVTGAGVGLPVDQQGAPTPASHRGTHNQSHTASTRRCAARAGNCQ